MSIFDFSDYRVFLQQWLKLQPRRGHGLLSQWAQSLRVSTTLISQILAGKKHLTHELAEGLGRVLALTEQELEYLLLLTDLERAGTTTLKIHFKKRVKYAQDQSRQLKNRIQSVSELSNEARAIYYSNWLYSGIRNQVACPKSDTVDLLSHKLELPRPLIAQIVEFLLHHALLKEVNGQLVVGPQSTYISPDSPISQKHHQNWRIKALQKLEKNNQEDLFYTSPMSLSDSLAKSLRRQVVEWIQAAQKQVAPSPSEVVRCLNIDLFEY